MSRKKSNKRSSSLEKLIDYAVHQEVGGISVLPEEKVLSNNHGESLISSHNSTDFLAQRIDDLSEIREKMPAGKEICFLDEDVLYSLLENVSQISMVVRSDILGYKNIGYSSRRKELVGHDNIKVSVPDNTILRVTLPPLIGRRFAGSFDMYWRTKIALEQFFSTENCPSFTNEKLLLIYKKYATDLSVCFTCDNDNWEMKRVTNAISEALNYSDNAEHFSMMYTAVKSHTNQVEATVIRLEKLNDFIAYLNEVNPTQLLE